MEPIIWLGVLAVLLVIEGLTTALTTIWFAGGALAAAIAAGIGMGIVPQLLLFFCVSLVLLFFTRPAALKLEIILSDSELRTRIASESRVLAYTTFNIVNLNHQLGELYESLS